MSVVVVGSANRDFVYRVPRIPSPGETVLATDAAPHAGGKGANQAIAAARAGASVEFITALGSDADGDVLAHELSQAGVLLHARRVDAPTGTAFVTVAQSGENAIVVNSGANAHLVEVTAVERDIIAASDFLLVQLETPLETVVEAATVARAAETVVVLNAAPICSLPERLLAIVDVLIVNEHEAIALARDLSGHRMPGETLSVDAAHDIAITLREAVPAVIITLGANGAIVLNRDMGDGPAAHVPAFRATPVDTTGAGDTFCGALVATLARGEDLVDAAQFASAAGALSVQRPGAAASIPVRAEIDALVGSLGRSRRG